MENPNINQEYERFFIKVNEEEGQTIERVPLESDLQRVSLTVLRKYFPTANGSTLTSEKHNVLGLIYWDKNEKKYIQLGDNGGFVTLPKDSDSNRVYSVDIEIST